MNNPRIHFMIHMHMYSHLRYKALDRLEQDRTLMLLRHLGFITQNHHNQHQNRLERDATVDSNGHYDDPIDHSSNYGNDRDNRRSSAPPTSASPSGQQQLEHQSSAGGHFYYKKSNSLRQTNRHLMVGGIPIAVPPVTQRRLFNDLNLDGLHDVPSDNEDEVQLDPTENDGYVDIDNNGDNELLGVDDDEDPSSSLSGKKTIVDYRSVHSDFRMGNH